MNLYKSEYTGIGYFRVWMDPTTGSVQVEFSETAALPYKATGPRQKGFARFLEDFYAGTAERHEPEIVAARRVLRPLRENHDPHQHLARGSERILAGADHAAALASKGGADARAAAALADLLAGVGALAGSSDEDDSAKERVREAVDRALAALGAASAARNLDAAADRAWARKQEAEAMNSEHVPVYEAVKAMLATINAAMKSGADNDEFQRRARTAVDACLVELVVEKRKSEARPAENDLAARSAQVLARYVRAIPWDKPAEVREALKLIPHDAAPPWTERKNVFSVALGERYTVGVDLADKRATDASVAVVRKAGGIETVRFVKLPAKIEFVGAAGQKIADVSDEDKDPRKVISQDEAYAMKDKLERIAKWNGTPIAIRVLINGILPMLPSEAAVRS